MLKDAKVLYVNKMVIFAATLHCALDDLLNQSADSWDQIREFVASEEAHKADLLCWVWPNCNSRMFYVPNEPLFPSLHPSLAIPTA